MTGITSQELLPILQDNTLRITLPRRWTFDAYLSQTQESSGCLCFLTKRDTPWTLGMEQRRKHRVIPHQLSGAEYSSRPLPLSGRKFGMLRHTAMAYSVMHSGSATRILVNPFTWRHDNPNICAYTARVPLIGGATD